jgi:hypothetical protein
MKYMKVVRIRPFPFFMWRTTFPAELVEKLSGAPMVGAVLDPSVMANPINFVLSTSDLEISSVL